MPSEPTTANLTPETTKDDGESANTAVASRTSSKVLQSMVREGGAIAAGNWSFGVESRLERAFLSVVWINFIGRDKVSDIT